MTVTDVNDNPPRLHLPQYIVIDEDTPVNSVVYTVLASDADTAPQLSYHVVQQSVPDLFAVASASGSLILTGGLDREASDRLSVTLEVVDGSQYSTQGQLTIRVGDSNDNPPVFPRADYAVQVSEDLSIGNSLLTVSATDADIGANAEIVYTIGGGNQEELFAVGLYSGELSLVQALDYEQRGTHVLTVHALDGGELPRTATATVTVTVTDVNDCVPVFALPQGSEILVQENTVVTAAGNHIVSVSASDCDPDVGGAVLYSISQGDAQVFAVDETTGDLTLRRSLDREETDSYQLVIQARDGGM